MSINVDEVMTGQVVTVEPHHTVDRVRRLMENNHVSAVPVVDAEGRPAGIVSSSDITRDVKDGTPVRHVMTEKVYTVPEYEGVHIAARIMRNHRIHRVVVTDHQKKVIGIVSAFDLLTLVEDHRFVLKNPPTPSKRKTGRT